MSISKEIEESLFKKLSGQEVHILAPGENPSSVAKMYNVSLKDLYDENPALKSTPSNKLQPGMKLKIPDHKLPEMLEKENVLEVSNEYSNLKIEDVVELVAKRYNLNPGLLSAQIMTESSYNPNASSPAGARGLMQLMPDRVKEYGVTDPNDPTQSIVAGAQYLVKCMWHARLLMRQGTDEEIYFMALMMYNGGPTRISNWWRGKGSLPKESENYAKKIFSAVNMSVPKSISSKM